MSLQVWLPLDGNLKNQGLSNIYPINDTGFTVDDSGKIGKCYLTNKKRLDFNISDLSSSSWSLATWFYPTTSSSSAHQYIISLNTSTANDFTGTLCLYADKLCARIGGTTYQGDAVDLNIWHHGVVTYDYINKVLKIYHNGNLVLTKNNPVTPVAATKVFIGVRGSGTTASFEGKLNDVRIYDHCLSVKEIKELAKGLILHYKLSKPLPNLLKDIPKAYSATAYNAYQLNFTENLVANQTYTLQLWDVNVSHSAKTAAQLGISFYWGGGSVRLIQWIGTDYFIDGHADYLVGTFTPTEANAQHSQAANAWFNVYNSPGNATGTRDMSIGKWKLEKGDKATGYIPDSSSSLYSAMGYDSNIELDCAPAGNQNDGTIVGTIAATADSPRYETSYYFDGSSYMNITNPFDTNTLIKDFSISCWIKKDYLENTSTRYIYNGIIQLYIYTNGRIRITWNHAADDLSYNSGNTWDCGISIPNNEWMHIAYTFSNGVIKVYKDGEYVSTSNKSNTGNNIRGYRGTTFNMSNSSQAFIGNVSDFRIYCTALSAEDIKELYDTAAQIDKNGNIYTYEYKEQ